MSHSGNSCVYRACSVVTGQGFSLFSFPRNPELAKSWLEACHRLDLINKINNMPKHYRLCEKHFEKTCISSNTTSRKRLLSDAVPTIFVHRIKREIMKTEPDRSESAPTIPFDFVDVKREIIKTEPDISKSDESQ